MNIFTNDILNVREKDFYKSLLKQTYENASKLFYVIIPIQLVLLIILAFFITPITWKANISSINFNIYLTIGLGLFSALLPMYLIKNNPSGTITRYAIAINQMLTSSMLINIFGGQVEAHFFIFISIAYLSVYKDLNVIIVATLVVVLDHLIRGFVFPFSLFGSNTVDLVRIIEHAIYVVILDIGIFFIIKNSIQETITIAKDKSKLLENQEIVDKTLNESNEIIDIQNTELKVLQNAMTELANGNNNVSYNTSNGEKYPIYQALSVSFNSFVKIQTQITNFTNEISKGNLDTVIEPRNQNDVLIISINAVQDTIKALVGEIKNTTVDLEKGLLASRLNETNFEGSYKDVLVNINNALNVMVNYLNLNSNTMIADKDRNITFVNHSLLSLFKEIEGDFKAKFSDFEYDKLVGVNIDKFHKKPEYNKDILNSLNRTHGASIEVGSKVFRLTINPVKNSENITTSFIVLWLDESSQIAFNSNLEVLSNELNNGNLNYRINTSTQSAEFHQLVNSINTMIDSIVTPLIDTSSLLDSISKGQIPDLITREYSGDFNIIKNNLNRLISTVNLIISELLNMTNEHNIGEIDVYTKVERFEGKFNELMTSINTLVYSHIDVKKRAIQVFEDFGLGNFKSDMEQLPGKKAFINSTINSVRLNLTNFNHEMLSLVGAAQRGELNYRADSKNFHGDWLTMVASLNELLDKIVAPIDEAGYILSELSQGDLTTRVSSNYGGDFEKLKNNINFLAESLDQVLTKVGESVQITASTAHQLSASSETMAAAAQEQSAQTDDVASAVEQMSRTITENARSAQRTAEVAEQNGLIAQQGGKAVTNTIEKMKDISKVVQNSATSIERLGSSSQAIGEIISVIEDIADQTNLLALNAAIEAARAGEQGRGFAVVADEVRKLAERTSDATKEIAKMIKGIQTETHEAVIVMQTGTKEVENGIKLADEAGQSLTSIVHSSQELINMITQISAASEEQSATSEEISSNVMSISKVISETARQIEDIANASDGLSQQTNLLSEIMTQFKLSEMSNSNHSKKLNQSRKNNLLN